MIYVVQQVINIIQLASIYGLVALGYCLVYGILSMVNFAHATLFMLAPFVGLLLQKEFHLSFFPLLIISMLIIAIISILIELAAYRPLEKSPKITSLVTSLSVGLIIENTVLALSPYPQRMPKLLETKLFLFQGATISSITLWIILSSMILLAFLELLVKKTRVGIAMRALSENRITLATLAIQPHFIILFTFALGGALAASAGIFYSIAYPIISSSLGTVIGWKAFIAAVIGGIGSLKGALLGALTLATTEIISMIFLPSSYRDLIAYSLLVVLLLLKPHGLLGNPAVKKI